jgi:GTP cyclohydrolase II
VITREGRVDLSPPGRTWNWTDQQAEGLYLQDEGFNTIDANHQLDLKQMSEYHIAASQRSWHQKIRLLTNSPEKLIPWSVMELK